SDICPGVPLRGGERGARRAADPPFAGIVAGEIVIAVAVEVTDAHGPANVRPAGPAAGRLIAAGGVREAHPPGSAVAGSEVIPAIAVEVARDRVFPGHGRPAHAETRRERRTVRAGDVPFA